MKMATTKAPKQVTVIARYAHKTQGKLNGIVSYAVRSSNGKDIYCTTLINGKASGCGCPAHKPCYHMVQLEQKEQERKAVAEVVAIEPLIETPAQEVAEAPKQTYRIISLGKRERRDFVGELTQNAEDKGNLLAECREIQARAKSEDLGKRGNLNVSRGFQLMR